RSVPGNTLASPRRRCRAGRKGGASLRGAVIGTGLRKLPPCALPWPGAEMSGNSLAVAAGLKTLEILQRTNAYEKLEAASARLGAGIALSLAHGDREIDRTLEAARAVMKSL